MKKLLLAVSVLSVIALPVFAQQTVQQVPPVQQYQPYNMNQNPVPYVRPSGNALGQQMVVPQRAQRQIGNNAAPYQNSGVEIQNLRKNKKSNQEFINQALERNRATTSGTQSR